MRIPKPITTRTIFTIWCGKASRLAESAKEGYLGASDALKVFQEHFSRELTNVDSALYDSIHGLENRTAVIEKVLAGFIASVDNRDRFAAVVEAYTAPGFRPSHREALIKLIRGEA